MAKKTWEFTLDNRSHKVEFRQSPITYRRKILVDGNSIEIPKEQRRIQWDPGTKHRFDINGHECIIATRSTGFNFTPELYIDGMNVETGLSIADADPTKVSQEAVRSRRIGVVAITLLFGILLFWLNARMILSSGRFYPELAMLGPVLLVIAGYYASNPDDPWVLPKPIPARMITMIILAILLGIANLWASDHGLYFLLFGSG
jgi:hypothetical protein